MLGNEVDTDSLGFFRAPPSHAGASHVPTNITTTLQLGLMSN